MAIMATLLATLLAQVPPSPPVSLAPVEAGVGFLHGDYTDYAAVFSSMVGASHSESRPAALDAACAAQGTAASLVEVVLAATGGLVSTSSAQAQCDATTICVVPAGATLIMDGSLNVGALRVLGALVWTDSTQAASDQWLCAGFVAVEANAAFNMTVHSGNAWLYIKDNGASHANLGTRSFGGISSEVRLAGRPLLRTWSLLASAVVAGSSSISLLHEPQAMGWRVGDRLMLAPTTRSSAGTADSASIASFGPGANEVVLSAPLAASYDANFLAAGGAGHAAPLSAEVINLSRNLVISGDEMSLVEPCSASTLSSQSCTMGLHTAQLYGGLMRIEHTRVERCGQRGMRAKYCMHLHLVGDCPACAFHGNAVEFGHQRGIVIHGTHGATVSHNVIADVRGAGIYVEDGNELWNKFLFNVSGPAPASQPTPPTASQPTPPVRLAIGVSSRSRHPDAPRSQVVICPWAREGAFSGCTVPGTDNHEADTALNQAGLWAIPAANHYLGNRFANSFNGLFVQARISRASPLLPWPSLTFACLFVQANFDGGNGRGSAEGAVCTPYLQFGRVQGNVNHGHGRFGTYFLGPSFPRDVAQSLALDGHVVGGLSTCAGFDASGQDRGVGFRISDNVDYGNVFVGQYDAGDLQYGDHLSVSNNNLIYWKTTKNFHDGCSAHLEGGVFAGGNMALPDQAAFIIEGTTFSGDTTLESNHHCHVGVTGVLCFPTYIFSNVRWAVTSARWMYFQADANHFGGIFALAPPEAANPTGHIFPPTFQSLCSHYYSFLLGIDGGATCVTAASLGADIGARYDGGILCRSPLRPLRVYTHSLTLATAPRLRVQLWQSGVMVSELLMPYHQIGDDGSTKKQGYAFPVVAGVGHEYRVALEGGGDVPSDWIVEFSDPVIGNRWATDTIVLTVAGRACGAQVDSSHDRRYLWSGVDDADHLTSEAWGRGACKGQPDMPTVDCSAVARPTLPACEGCGEGGDGAVGCEDTCSAARCGANGTCTARFLGAGLPVSRRACICEPPFTGPTCELDPCAANGETCSGRGTCVGVGDTSTRCVCERGYSGPSCELDCSATCAGNGGLYPFGCNDGLAAPVHFCGPSGGCQYANSLTEGNPGWCAYKVEDACAAITCTAPDDCHLAGPCAGGVCGSPTPLPDGTPCSGVPWGTCLSGACIATSTNCAPSPPPAPPAPPPSSHGTLEASAGAGMAIGVGLGAVAVVLLGGGAIVHRWRLRRRKIADAHGKDGVVCNKTERHPSQYSAGAPPSAVPQLEDAAPRATKHEGGQPSKDRLSRASATAGDVHWWSSLFSSAPVSPLRASRVTGARHSRTTHTDAPPPAAEEGAWRWPWQQQQHPEGVEHHHHHEAFVWRWPWQHDERQSVAAAQKGTVTTVSSTA